MQSHDAVCEELKLCFEDDQWLHVRMVLPVVAIARWLQPGTADPYANTNTNVSVDLHALDPIDQWLEIKHATSKLKNKN